MFGLVSIKHSDKKDSPELFILHSALYWGAGALLRISTREKRAKSAKTPRKLEFLANGAICWVHTFFGQEAISYRKNKEE